MRFMQKARQRTKRATTDQLVVDEPTHTKSDQVRADAMRVRDWIDQEIED